MLTTMRRTTIFALGLLFLATVAVAGPSLAQDVSLDNEVRQTWKLLDYLAVDYSGAVENGTVVSDFEYAEMQEFAATAGEKVTALPPRAGYRGLVAQTAQLQAAIDALATPEEVARLAHELANSLLTTYPVPVAPATVPDPARGAVLFMEKCFTCHGLEGRGDGPAAANLDPPPIAFTDHARARERSLFSLYEVISQGLADTPMIGFQDAYSDEERWALAFHVGNFAYAPELRQKGKELWRDDPALRARFPNLESLVRTTEAVFAEEAGADKARAALAYLRSRPDVIEEDNAGTLILARTRLAESLEAYRAGNAAQATSLALSAYLDGFEPVEPLVRARDSELMVRVETAMGEYRSRIGAGAPVEQVAIQKQVVDELFTAVDATLAISEGDAMAAFVGALTILLREGLEALLVVVAMIGFLVKVERRDVLPYVHAGWIGALGAGAITWGVAVFLVDISGANRELTEGFSALFAAVVLLGVGIWMHQKSLAGRWQAYIKDKMSAVLTRKSAFLLFALSFVVVYREVFETILFYVALWTSGNGESILAGMAVGAIALAVVTVVLLRTSRRLPIGQFFAASSALIAVLAFVLAGKGVAALEEAGMVPVITVDFPRIDWLGVYPSALPLLGQLAVIVFLVAGFVINMRSVRATIATGGAE